MRKFLIGAVAAIALSAVTTPVQAQGAPAAEITEAHRKVIRILYHQHLDQAVMAWREMLLQSATPACGCRDESGRRQVQAAWRKAISAAYQPDSFLDEVVAAYRTSFTPAELDKLDAFHMSPLGAKLFRLQGVREIESHAAALAGLDNKAVQRAMTAEPARTRLVAEIVHGSGGVDAQFDIMTSFSLAMALGATAVVPAGRPRPEPAQIAAQIESALAAARPEMERILLVLSGMVYKSLSLAELTAYRDHLKSPLGVKNRDVFLATFKASLSARALAIGSSFSRDVASVEM